MKKRGLTVVVRPLLSPGDVRRFLLLICLTAVTACGGNPTKPDVPFNEPFTLAVGESASFADVPLIVEFLGVSGDSRCPADAVCIQGGDAIVKVRVRMGFTNQYELHTGDSARATATHGSVRISLVDLQPYPFSSRTITQDEYRVTLTVARQ
jgi:hypothetical protein